MGWQAAATPRAARSCRLPPSPPPPHHHTTPLCRVPQWLLRERRRARRQTNLELKTWAQDLGDSVGGGPPHSAAQVRASAPLACADWAAGAERVA
jgi:hypothetical protein